MPKGEVFEVVRKSIKKLQGESVNVDIKKLKGEWSGFYRNRIGKIRVIIEIDLDAFSVFVERIDFRGAIYNK